MSKSKPKRYCEMCDRLVHQRECSFCGADTQPLPKAQPWPARIEATDGD